MLLALSAAVQLVEAKTACLLGAGSMMLAAMQSASNPEGCATDAHRQASNLWLHKASRC